MVKRFKNWLILKLGGFLADHDCKSSLWWSLNKDLRKAAQMASEKVRKDPGFANYEGSNLGRNVLRDEASEWTRLYLKEWKVEARESDAHLAVELYYHLFMRDQK